MLGSLLSSNGKKVNKKERVSTIMGLSLLEDTDNYSMTLTRGLNGGGTGCHGKTSYPDVKGGSRCQKTL